MLVKQWHVPLLFCSWMQFLLAIWITLNTTFNDDFSISALRLSKWVTSIHVYDLTYSLGRTIFFFFFTTLFFSFEQLSGYILIYLTLMCTNRGQKALDVIPVFVKTHFPCTHTGWITLSNIINMPFATYMSRYLTLLMYRTFALPFNDRRVKHDELFDLHDNMYLIQIFIYTNKKKTPPSLISSFHDG